jgi:hypothetical protein
MSLYDLPLELTARVLYHLAQQESAVDRGESKPHIGQYASTSFSIQCAVEQHLFSRLSLTSDDTSAFEKLVAQSPRRQALLRTISFTPILPAYDEVACSRFERQADQEENNEALTAVMRRLYAALRGCSKLSSVTVNIPYSPTDNCEDRRARYANDRLAYMLGQKVDIRERRYVQSLLELQMPLDSPPLAAVRTFTLSGDGPRYITPCSALTLLKRHPRVEVLTLNLDDNERRRPELRAQLRTDFARDLLLTSCPALRRLDLSYRYEDPSDQRFVNMDVRGARGNSNIDVSSTSLRKFLIAAPNLESVNLGGPICIDESLFESSDSHSSKRWWLGLRELRIEMSAVRPDGGWYLDEDLEISRNEPSRQTPRALGEVDDDDGDLDSDSESSAFSDNSFFAQDELQPDDFDPHWEALKSGDAYIFGFRFQPNAAFEKVLEAVARLADLNDIVHLSLRMGVAGCPRTDQRAEMFELELEAKPRLDSSTEDDSPCAKLYLGVPREWQMSDTLAALLKSSLGPKGVTTYERW